MAIDGTRSPGGPPAADNLTAACLALGATALFALMNVSVRALGTIEGPDLPALEITFFRYLFGFLAASAFLVRHGPGVLATRQPGRHLVRVACGAGGIACMFAALAVLQVGLVTAISFASPFFTMVFAVLVLGEAVGLRRWSAAAVGFCGVLVMTDPFVGAFQPALLLAVAAAIFMGIENGMIKKLFQTERLATILLINNGMGIVLALVPAVLVWQTPAAHQWPLLAATGFSVVAGQILFLMAMQRGEANFVAPFNYATLIYALLFGFLLFGEEPSTSTITGALIIVGAGLYVLYRERLSRR